MKANEPITWGIHGRQLVEYMQLILDVVPMIQESLDAEAEALQAEFFERRKSLQEPHKDRNGRLPSDLFSPLGFHKKWSGHGSTLELGWHEQHFFRGKRRKVIRLRKGGGTRYPQALLARHARPYEWALVQEIEEKAECIRRRWKWAQMIKQTNKFLANDPYARGRPRGAGAGAGVNAAGAAPVESMCTLRDGTSVPLPHGVLMAAWLAYRDDPNVDAPHPQDLRPRGGPDQSGYT